MKKSAVLASVLFALPAAAADPLLVVSRLHMPMVHFPVALLVIAFIAELVLGRRSEAHRPTISFVLVVATLASFVAASSGIALENAEAMGGDAVERHEVLGIATAIVALIASLAYRQNSGLLRKLSTPLLGVAAGLVMLAGHLGGKLVHGADYYSQVFGGDHTDGAGDDAYPVDDKDDKDAKDANSTTPVDVEAKEPAAEARARFPEGEVPEKPDYATHIAPLFKRSCVKCHGAEKRKAGLRLDAKRFALKGGESGDALVPGNPAKSLVYTMAALPPDDEDVMPTKGRLLAQSEIETIKRWIDQGAAWPDDATP